MTVKNTELDDKELIAQLRAALSWELAKQADNPALQAMLEQERDKDPMHHINKLGIYHPRYRYLFL